MIEQKQRVAWFDFRRWLPGPWATDIELRERIQAIYDLGDRMNARDYLGRLWVADYCSSADTLADCLLDILNGAPVPLDT